MQARRRAAGHDPCSCRSKPASDDPDHLLSSTTSSSPQFTRHMTADLRSRSISAGFQAGCRCTAHAGREIDALCLDLPDGGAVGSTRWARSGIGGSGPSRSIRPRRRDRAPLRLLGMQRRAARACGRRWTAFWMNPPEADERAMKKVFQHRMAQRGAPDAGDARDQPCRGGARLRRRAWRDGRDPKGVPQHPEAPRQTALKVGLRDRPDRQRSLRPGDLPGIHPRSRSTCG